MSQEEGRSVVRVLSKAWHVDRDQEVIQSIEP